MRAFIEYPDISEDRIEVTKDLYVVTSDRAIEDVIERWESKSEQ